MKKIVTSIIICTCNRVQHLHSTLEALAQVCVPEELPVELIVVDNGSTDDTAEVVQSCRLPYMPVRYLFEGRQGQCYARNTGLAAARGQVILFTDDDVRLPKDWIAGMCGPILAGKADAVAGGVKIAPHLERPWMTPQHRSWLAATEEINPDAPSRMVGANMAFSKAVLEKVPQFDTELGPGALGFCDETLFSLQLRQAGYTLVSAFPVSVEHHFDPSRLSQEVFKSMAEKQGRSLAYFSYHWEHMTMDVPYVRLAYALLKNAFLRMRGQGNQDVSEKIDCAEIARLQRVAFIKQHLKERQRPRRYAKYGLVLQVSPKTRALPVLPDNSSANVTV